MTKPGALTLALFLALGAAAPAAPLSSTQIDRIDTLAARAMAKQHIAGMEIAVGRAGRVLYVHGYGMRDLARRLPVTASTVFPVGSITKQFTAACVMMLVSRGRVRLDAPVATYLPNAPHGREVTVRELLDQTSGLPDYLENKPLLTSIMAGAVRDAPVASYVALVRNDKLHFAPGTKFEYSNTNYALAGMIVARAGGISYAQFLRTHIFDALGLHTMQYLAVSVPSGTNASRGYNYTKAGFQSIPPFSMAWANAAGAIASDAADLVRWDGAYFGGRVIPPGAVRVSTTPPAHVAMLKSNDASNNIGMGYAFGWVQARAEGRNLVWHNGGLPGARAMNAQFARDGLEIVVLTNATVASPEPVALQIARVIYDGPGR